MIIAGTLHEDHVNLLYLSEFLLEWAVFQTKVVKKIKYTFYVQ